MMISVIIPVFNEEKEILDCLESLGKQNYKDFEIIVVDDGSTDNSVKELDNLAKVLPSFKYFKQGHKGPGAARNLGAEHAKGEILVFVDADMTFDESFLTKLTAPIVRGTSSGTFSKEEYVSNWDSVWARCWNVNEGWEEKRRHPKGYPSKQKVFRAILTSEFKKVGGFTPGGYTDDYSVSEKLGFLASGAPGAVFFHKNPDSLSEVFKQARWASKRKYKLSWLGYPVAIVRASFPVSVVTGLFKALIYSLPAFLVFKIVYDFGTFVGILNYLFTGKASK
jgi:glycosyltransferase involved in cell wall biosynthesis